MLAFQLACGGWIASAVGAAARLGIVDLLSEGPRSAEELADATGTSVGVLERLLTLLEAVGLLVRTGDGRFENGAEAEVLRADHPRSMRNFCILASGEYQVGFGQLMHTLYTGKQAFDQAFGSALYTYLENEPGAAQTYEAAMDELARPVGPAVLERVDVADVRTIVDAGGGRGTGP